ncbi:MAG: hypothetical protein DHS20C21_09500 [Gemmatimonadota bacterium]|nr:MAG: hypothetical protein DHS20C21_09500 [Gemmatimonadota bacterium]
MDSRAFLSEMELVARDPDTGRVELDRRVLWPGVAAWITEDHWSRERHSDNRAARVAASAACLVLMRSGCFLNRAGDDLGVCDPGNVALYNCDRVVHTRTSVARRASNAFYIHPDFVAHLAEEILPGERLDPLSPFSRLTGVVSAEAYLLYHEITSTLLNGEPVDPLRLEEALVDLLERVLRSAWHAKNPRRRLGMPRVRNRIPDLQARLSADHARPYRLEDLAAWMGCTPWHLSRLFTQEAGVPISRYLQRIRVRHSLERFRQGADSLADVALEVGFGSHSHFAGAFRQEFGCTPSEVRRRLRG